MVIMGWKQPQSAVLFGSGRSAYWLAGGPVHLLMHTDPKLLIRLANPSPRTYIGSGKVAEMKSAIHALDVETVIFDDELSAG
ncbi:hypothetical protein GW17_00027358 [Ensete ventricosum]|nr:hypothetical protein GW17_00027358 [Ensete ventricosum]